MIRKLADILTCLLKNVNNQYTLIMKLFMHFLITVHIKHLNYLYV